LKVAHPLKIYQHTKLNGPKLTGENVASTSKVQTSDILEWFKLRDKNYGVEVIFNGITSLLNFIQMYDRGNRYRREGDFVSLLFSPLERNIGE
jgi:hypothetical protein